MPSTPPDFTIFGFWRDGEWSVEMAGPGGRRVFAGGTFPFLVPQRQSKDQCFLLLNS